MIAIYENNSNILNFSLLSNSTNICLNHSELVRIQLVQIYYFVSTFASVLQSIEVLTIVLLSCFWAIHLVHKLMKTKKIHTLQLSEVSNEEKQNMAEIHKIWRNKNRILLTICICELVIAFSVIFLTFFGNLIVYSKELQQYYKELKLNYFHRYFEFPHYDHLEANNHVIFRLVNSLLLTSFMSIVILVRIITQYMHSCYSYFKQPMRLKQMILYFCCTSAVVFLLGIFRYSIWIHNILYPIILMFEYVLYIRYTIKLNRCLYNRYFDSVHHEYRENWVRNYYKKSHIGYKLCTISIAIAILCYIIMLSILPTMRQLFYLEFLKPVRSIEGRYRLNYLNVSSAILNNSFSILASVFFITPYIVFSLGYVYVQVKRWYKFRKNNFYSDPSLIRGLIQHQNTAYQRTVVNSLSHSYSCLNEVSALK